MMDKENKKPRVNNRTLKYPVLKNLEYISIVKNKKSVLELDKNKLGGLENKTWREFQLFLGEHLTPGRYYFTIKFLKNPELHTGQVRAVSSDGEKTEGKMDSEIVKQFNELKEALTNATNSGGVTFDMLLQSTKSGYEAHITLLNKQIEYKDTIIIELKGEIKELENELDKAQKEYNKVSGSEKWIGVIDKYAPALELFFKSKNIAPAKLPLATNVDSSGIPDEVIAILAQVDYDKLKQDQEKYKQILGYLQQYISMLPLKVDNNG